MRREREVFEIQCWACGSTVEIGCCGPHVCVKCGARLKIEWRLPEAVEPKAVSVEKDAAVSA